VFMQICHVINNWKNAVGMEITLRTQQPLSQDLMFVK